VEGGGQVPEVCKRFLHERRRLVIHAVLPHRVGLCSNMLPRCMKSCTLRGRVRQDFCESRWAGMRYRADASHSIVSPEIEIVPL
jgi:hypothetical protein